jgi:hypothetical protein
MILVLSIERTFNVLVMLIIKITLETEVSSRW